MEQYLLQTPDNYYWIWFKPNREGPRLNGPHSEPYVNLPVIKVNNPMDFDPLEKRKHGIAV